MDQDNAQTFRPEEQIQYWINRAGFLLRREIGERFNAAGLELSAEEMALLMQIQRKPGQTPSDLADLTIRDRTTVTRFLDGMAKKGLIERNPDPNDRRRVIVCATDKAKTLIPEVMKIAQGLVRDSLKEISHEDAEVTRRVLIKLTDNLLELRN